MVLRAEIAGQACNFTAGQGRGGDDQFGKVARQTIKAIRPRADVQRLSLIEVVRLRKLPLNTPVPAAWPLR